MNSGLDSFLCNVPTSYSTFMKKHSCITIQVLINFGSNFDYMKAMVADIILIHFDAHFIFVKKDFWIGCGEDESRK